MAVGFYDRWSEVRRDLESRDGYSDSLLYVGPSPAEYPFLNVGLWDDARAFAEARDEQALVVGDGVLTGVYETVAHRGDLRETPANLSFVRLPSQEGVDESFRTAAEWFGQRRGFGGAVLMRRTLGDGPEHIVLATWSSGQAMREATSNMDFPLHTMGGSLTTYALSQR